MPNYFDYQTPQWMQRGPTPEQSSEWGSKIQQQQQLLGKFGGANTNFWDPMIQQRRGEMAGAQSKMDEYKSEQQSGYELLAQLIAQATDPANTNRMFDVGASNLRRTQGASAGGAQAAAGAYGASNNLLNRGNFVQGAGSQARGQYAGAFGQLEQGRATALADLAKKAFEMNHLLNRAQQGDKESERKLELMAQQVQYQTQDAGVEDWIAALLPGGAQFYKLFMGA